MIPPADGTTTLAAFLSKCFTAASPPVDFFAVSFVLAIMKVMFLTMSTEMM
jgi:hypothetical protein